ncbi:helix-turn-helix domain-containing protein [Halogeometricum limi]|uniref:Predicted DNA binding protein, contains HTH domain n=1 Tax=Halogeometricum limi TaxID=555875 RepID=A0A1I6FZM9_9EURY|nr:helix-turn-helix domain-containing protein [Halogeometricum limi]SFR35388.1 Predicted DNA binding protein, contains HTH domain [Halogeometricum limi]
MTLVAEFSLPRHELLLADLPSDWSGRVEFERLVPTPSPLFPFVRVTGDTDAFAASVRADPAVDSLVELAVASTWTRYRLRWSPATERAIRSLLSDTVVTRAVATNEWTFGFRFREFGDMAAFREDIEASSFSFELRRLRDESRTEEAEANLTAIQRETLSVALSAGYFEVPRSATLSDLADELGVSKQAVSERLRRATGILAEETVEGLSVVR